ncbi:MAG: aminopeptidase P family protein [Pseudomonadota bacterium]
MKSISYQEKLDALRAEMKAHDVDGFLVPRADEYQSEAIAPYAERLSWLTGFTGSAGIGIILEDQACVMSDGRYTIQLKQEVEEGLYHLVNSQEVPVEEWLSENVGKEKVIGYDPKLHTPHFIQKLEEAGVKLKSIEQNLIDLIWDDQPEPPKNKISLFPSEVAGQTAQEKIAAVQAILAERGCGALVITQLDSIAWLLNIRGADVENTPVPQASLILLEGEAQLFIDSEKLTEDIKENFQSIISFHERNEEKDFLRQLHNQKIWLDTKRSSVYYKNILNDIEEEEDPCVHLRACKSVEEQEAMKEAHLLDGIAITKFLHWFDQEASKENLTEINVEEQLERFRKEAPQYKEPSFSTIAGFGSNGAIVHYRASQKTNKQIEQGNLLLLDSGGQYHYGTTDITRTIAVGTPTEEMIHTNTLVLKGHITLATAQFTRETLGKELDLYARGALANEGLGYAHGTGHGVGCYLSVHEEAAMGISPRAEKPLAAGMILSNEPGYYKEGEFGIRIENLVLVKSKDENELYFETITLAPIDKTLIDKSLLTESEIQWFNSYHQAVFDALSPHLEDGVKKWLEKATLPI